MKKYTIKEIRTEILKMSQESLAHALGITKQAYVLKEKYVHPLKAKELIAICQMAEIDPRLVVIE